MAVAVDADCFDQMETDLDIEEIEMSVEWCCFVVLIV